MTCAIDGCNGEALDDDQRHVACGRHLCRVHSTPEFHPCLLRSGKLLHKTCKDHHQLFDLIRRIGEAPIAAAALKFRPAVASCAIQLPKLNGFKLSYHQDLLHTMGGCNINVPVVFDDGVVWYARVRLPSETCSPDELKLVMYSEYTTMNEVKALAPQFVPNVWMPEQTGGINYFFVERIAGTVPRILLSTNGRQATRAIKNLADYFCQVASRSLPVIGSLHPKHGDGSQVGADVSSTAVLGFSFDVWEDGLIRFGPFTNSAESYTQRIRCYMDLLESSDEAMPDRLLTYLISLEMLALVAGCPEMAKAGPTYIKHSDDHLGNFLLKDDGSLAALVDWEYASTAPLDEAFIAPWALLEWTKFKSGVNTLSPGEQLLHDELLERSRPDIAAAVAGGRKYHRLRQIIELEPNGTTLVTLRALREAFLGDRAGPHPRDEDDWLQLAMERYGMDWGLDKLLDMILARALLVVDTAAAAANAAWLQAGELQCTIVGSARSVDFSVLDLDTGAMRWKVVNRAAAQIPTVEAVIAATRAETDSLREVIAKADGYASEARAAHHALDTGLAAVFAHVNGEAADDRPPLGYDPMRASVRWTSLVTAMGDAAGDAAAAARRADETLRRCERLITDGEAEVVLRREVEAEIRRCPRAWEVN